MKHSLTEGAKIAGVSKSALYRALCDGHVSHEKDSKNRIWIDTAELQRAYPETFNPKQAKCSKKTDLERNETTKNTSEMQEMQLELATLRERVKLVDELRERAERAEKLAEAEKEEKRVLLRLLEAPKPSQAPIPEPAPPSEPKPTPEGQKKPVGLVDLLLRQLNRSET